MTTLSEHTYRIAVVSDIHADVEALSDALRLAQALGCADVVCAGDLVGYGAFPEETLALLDDRGVRCVRGNHDRWTLERRVEMGAVELSKQARDFIESLPTSLLIERHGTRVAVHHARPRSDMQGIDPDWVDAPTCRGLLAEVDADVLFVGHTHGAFALAVDDGLIANPGALLRAPVAPNPPRAPGTFGVLELPARAFRVFDSRTGAEVAVARRRLG